MDTPGVGIGNFILTLFKKADQRFKMVRQVAVVVVQVGDILSLSSSNAGVPSRGESAVLIVFDRGDTPGPVVGPHHGFHIHVAVVDHDDFKILEGLGIDTGQRLAEPLWSVVCGDDHRNRRRAIEARYMSRLRRRQPGSQDLVDG